MNLGSSWRKWDLHVHTPETVLANEYGTWDEFLNALENETEICAIGVTDYLSIEGYKRLMKERQHRSFGSISLLVPNIEFRITPQTDRGHAINLHLLIDPTRADHIAKIDSSLTRLSIKYLDGNYSCTPSEIMRLGGEFDPNATTAQKKLEVGTNQYKIDFRVFMNWLMAEPWLTQNSLVAISGGNDGPSGLKDDGWEASQEEIWRSADIVLTANENNRNFWLCKDPAKRDGATKLGAPKPCISGSDAHSMKSLFRTAGERFCWIKADPTFEGLKSILYEPEERVYVGKFYPIQHDVSRVIARVIITGSPTSGIGSLSIPLNSGLVSVIGAKGSGKSALADYLAYAGGAIAQEDKRSFLYRARQFVKGTSVELVWGDGGTTSAVVGNKPPTREMVRYLSQSFVEQLCSEDYAGKSLAEEIEKVIFGHLDPTDTLNASSFASLRAIRTDDLIRQRIALGSRIRSLIAEDEALRDDLRGIPAKKKRIEELAQEATSLKKQIPKAESEKEANAQRELTTLREKLLFQQSAVATQKQFLQGIDNLQGTISRFSTQVKDFEKDLSERAKAVGIEPKKLFVKFEVTGQEALMDRRTAVGDLIVQLESSKGLAAKSITELNEEIALLDKSVANDKIQRSLIQQLQKRISVNSQETQRLQKEILTSERETVKKQERLRADRLEVYKRTFDLWKDEQQTLELLYKPVQEKLRAGDEEEKQLDFYIRWNVDIDSWIDRGNALFDQRRGHPFGSATGFKDEVEETLVPAWGSGDPDQIKIAMEKFLDKVKLADAASFLRQSVSHAMMLEWIFGSDHITLDYGLRYYGTEIEKLSPGTKGIVLLILYLAMDIEDSRPLIVDQPEENLDNESIYSLLSFYFRKAKQRRQVIIITHNPNLVVNTDAEQVIIATASRTKGVFPEFTYEGGALEDIARIRKRVCNILEGGERAFLEREKRYALSSQKQPG
ncbi:MAG: AAA family ATPase [Acidobacteriaceae bacterium]